MTLALDNKRLHEFGEASQSVPHPRAKNFGKGPTDSPLSLHLESHTNEIQSINQADRWSHAKHQGLWVGLGLRA